MDILNNFAPVNELLQRFEHFGVELGLERIQRLLQDLDNPQQHVPIVHVAGSNGKGSVCAYLSSVLTAAGYRVGRYTSPHLVNWGERICLNEQPIAATDLYTLLQQVIAAIRPDRPSPTQFEIITAAAWLYFAQQQVDLAIVEVGLGGRLDATNVCARSLVSIITSISREHWQKLGPTLADIAREKAGILKPGSPALIGMLPSEAAQATEQRAAELNCPTFWVKPSIELESGWAEYQGVARVQNLDSRSGDRLLPILDAPLQYPLALLGRHQLMNSALAIAGLQILRQQGWQISTDALVQGMKNTQWAARLQWVKWRETPLLIDAAHNSAGAAMLRDYIDQSDRVAKPVTWIMGLIANKDHDDIFRALLRSGDTLHLAPVPDHISADPQMLEKLAWEICPDLAASFVHETALQGLEAADRDRQTSRIASTLVLCGSIYLIGSFLQQIEAAQI